MFETFLFQVAQAPEQTEAGEAIQNGERRIQLIRPSAQEVLGLEAEEARLLRRTALDFCSEIGILDRSRTGWRREALFQKIESGRVSDGLARRMQRFEEERARLVAEAIDRLKLDLGASRFEMVEAFVRAKAGPGHTYFRPVPATGTEALPAPRRQARAQ